MALAAFADLAGDRPTFCEHCYRSLWMGGRCKRRDCPGYVSIYLRDQAERIRANLAVWDGKTCLMTLTAPGADKLPWDRSKCPPGQHVCSGKLGCQVDWVAAAAWNSDLTKRLGDLLKAARERVRRRHGGGGEVRVLAYVCEAHARGVFHVHVVLGYRTAGDRAALDTFLGAVRRLRGGYGFGTGRHGSFDAGQPERFGGSDAGRYISKYLRPDRAKASFIPLLERVGRIGVRDPATGRLKHLLRPVYVSPILTRQTGVTMGYLRFKRWAWRAWGDGVPERDLHFAYALRQQFDAIPLATTTGWEYRGPPTRAG